MCKSNTDLDSIITELNNQTELNDELINELYITENFENEFKEEKKLNYIFYGNIYPDIPHKDIV